MLPFENIYGKRELCVYLNHTSLIFSVVKVWINRFGGTIIYSLYLNILRKILLVLQFQKRKMFTFCKDTHFDNELFTISSLLNLVLQNTLVSLTWNWNYLSLTAELISWRVAFLKTRVMEFERANKGSF